MNRFEIFSLLALFCISFVPVQAERTPYKKIKKAIIDTMCDDEKSVKKMNTMPPHLISRYVVELRVKDSRTFKGDVTLYSTDEGGTSYDYYVVGDDNALSAPFAIDQHNTAVTDENITVIWCDKWITLTVHESPFEFYQNLPNFSLEGFDRPFSVTSVSLGSKKMNDVSVIKAKKIGLHDWLFVALADDTPRLIFPKSCLKEKSSEHVDNKVSVVLYGRKNIKIMAKFEDYDKAIRFNDFLVTMHLR